MAIRDILRMGDARLLRVAEAVVGFDAPELHALVADLTETMHANDGVGLAAPQIGVNLQVVVFGVESNPRYPDAEAVPFTVLINPILRAMSEEMEESWEGCLSVPGLRGKVPRHLRLHYSGFDQYGQRIEREVAGFHARVVQHETDHLWGILYPRRIRDLRNFGFSDVLSPDRTD